MALIIASPLFNAVNASEIRCAVSQMKASATLCQQELKCYGLFVKQFIKDPTGVKADRCLLKAENKFIRAYDRAINKEYRLGKSCAIDTPAPDVKQVLESSIYSIIYPILNADEWTNQKLNNLYASAVIATSAYCKKVVIAEANNVKKLAPAVLKKRLNSSRKKLNKKLLSITKKASKKDLPFHSPLPNEIAINVDNFKSLVLNMAPQSSNTDNSPSLISPIRGAYSYGDHPEFRWYAIPGASLYELYVLDVNLIYKGNVYKAGAIGCSTGICNVFDIPLKKGFTQWKVRAYKNGKWMPYSGLQVFYVEF